MDPYFYEIMLNEADVVISDGIFQGWVHMKLKEQKSPENIHS
jgi:hypothetical protein